MKDDRTRNDTVSKDQDNQKTGNLNPRNQNPGQNPSNTTDRSRGEQGEGRDRDLGRTPQTDRDRSRTTGGSDVGGTSRDRDNME
jgi:hypothetical protein